jgi:Tol biopolymer transport system component
MARRLANSHAIGYLRAFLTFLLTARYIIYVSAEGSGRIVRMNIDGSDPMPLTPTGNGQDNADISPDDRWVIYSHGSMEIKGSCGPLYPEAKRSG